MSLAEELLLAAAKSERQCPSSSPVVVRVQSQEAHQPPSRASSPIFASNHTLSLHPTLPIGAGLHPVVYSFLLPSHPSTHWPTPLFLTFLGSAECTSSLATLLSHLSFSKHHTHICPIQPPCYSTPVPAKSTAASPLRTQIATASYLSILRELPQIHNKLLQQSFLPAPHVALVASNCSPWSSSSNSSRLHSSSSPSNHRLVASSVRPDAGCTLPTDGAHQSLRR